MRALATKIFTGTLLAGSMGFATQAMAKPFIYDVTVKTSFGTTFKDCFTFDGGNLTVASLGTLKYKAAPTITKFYYTATITLADANAIGFTIAFAGFHKGNSTDGSLHAVGDNSYRDSYKVEGTAVSACSGSSSAKQGANYIPAQ